MKTKVLIRETGNQVEVLIRDDTKPRINDYLKEKWQNIISLVADILNVPAALIMQISETHMNIFLKSENSDNPYPSNGKDNLLHGLYCETVIGEDKALHVDNSLNNKIWKDNPDVSLDMISYYGLPLKWEDGTFFGTICALDKKTNQFEEKYRKLIFQFKDIIEQDLRLFEKTQLLEEQIDFDSLTGAYNRRKFDEVLQKNLESFSNNEEKFTLALIDINSFKYINDTYGHVIGDKVLKRFSEVITNEIANDDSFFRYGGDEFSLITKLADENSVKDLIKKLAFEVKKDEILRNYFIDFSYGYYVVNKSIKKADDIISLADKNMYINKKNRSS